jgi:hypothetical protein
MRLRSWGKGLIWTGKAAYYWVWRYSSRDIRTVMSTKTMTKLETCRKTWVGDKFSVSAKDWIK